MCHLLLLSCYFFQSRSLGRGRGRGRGRGFARGARRGAGRGVGRGIFSARGMGSHLSLRGKRPGRPPKICKIRFITKFSLLWSYTLRLFIDIF